VEVKSVGPLVEAQAGLAVPVMVQTPAAVGAVPPDGIVTRAMKYPAVLGSKTVGITALVELLSGLANVTTVG